MDHYFILLIIGFLAAVIGVSLPGLLNMTAVKVAQERGRQASIMYIAGASSIIFVQTYIAIFFAKLIDSSPFITEILHEIGLVIFGSLTLYFLVFAKRKKKEENQAVKRLKHPYIYGALLALINVFSIPYYVFLSVTLAAYHYPIFDWAYTVVFSIGVVLGSGLMFYAYISVFKKVANENAFLLRNINYVIGTITGIICLITLYKLLR
ncbi:LysE family transporter [Myroides sp. NP-2]|uniref:LysE family transporter n=1 Tax=Myroides sp. NP-2 TaxID=2759945 RepID=UPI0015FA2F2F|nr:LysE family transporter [Myroides sp. NP-2]MBB1150663.1 LysE family transporter [Myroides sp. NP-2]